MLLNLWGTLKAFYLSQFWDNYGMGATAERLNFSPKFSDMILPHAFPGIGTFADRLIARRFSRLQSLRVVFEKRTD